MPGERLALAVRVGCKVDVSGFLGCIPDLFNCPRLVFRDDVFGEEVIIDLNTEIAFWKIADMADGRFDVVLGAKDARNRPCFGWRLDHDEALAILGGHRHGLSATRVRAAPAD